MHRSQAGQSLTEFALLLPLLVLVLLGVVEVARIYESYVTITNAAREGARYGIEHPTITGDCATDKTIKYRTCQEAANSDITLTSGDITVSCPDASGGDCSAAATGTRITVTVNYTYSFLTTYLFGVGQMTISNYATMAITNGLASP